MKCITLVLSLLVLLLFSTIQLNSQEVDIDGNINMSGNINFGDFGAEQGSIRNVDFITGFDDIRFGFDDSLHMSLSAEGHLSIGITPDEARLNVFRINGPNVINVTSAHNQGSWLKIESTDTGGKPW